MSRSSYRAPFHRQIIPWIFAAVFLATAPVLIFYTSGYRLNTKKNVIERNGTLIVDSTPRGAKIFLDHQLADRVTPATFQEVAPGSHVIRVEREGYAPWEKRLDVRPQQVTFANAIWLWRTVEPEFLHSSPVTSLTDTESRNAVAAVSAFGATSTFTFWSPATGFSEPTALLGAASGSRPLLRWSEDGRSVLAGGEEPNAAAWWARLDGPSVSPQPLPDGMYFWIGNELHGNTGDATYMLNPRTRALERTPLPSDAVDIMGSLRLLAATGTSNLLLYEPDFERRRVSLPPGNWRFAGLQGRFALLKDGSKWLSYRLDSENPAGTETAGSWPIWLRGAGEPTALLVHGNEVILWQLGAQPETIWRQSEPIIFAGWHRSGLNIFLATQTHVFTLELDARDGRRTTTLGAFDRVYDIAVSNGSLYVAAEREGRHGIWRIATE